MSNSSKKILGLSIETEHIGWAFVEKQTNDEYKIIGAGVRVVNLDPEEIIKFKRGVAFSKNQVRTNHRLERRRLDRFQQRKSQLAIILKSLNMAPTEEQVLRMDKLPLWELRAKAATEKLPLSEIGRVFMHLIQRRGYADNGKEFSGNNSEFIAQMKDWHQRILRERQTVGQYFYERMLRDQHFQVRGIILPRAAYEQEFDSIWNTQKTYYPEIFNKINYRKIKEETLFYQRPLKAKRDPLLICKLEGKQQGDKWIGPKVAPLSSPIYQVARLWESINDLRITNREGHCLTLDQEQRQAIFEAGMTAKKLTAKKIQSILKLSPEQGWSLGHAIDRGGLEGFPIYVMLNDILRLNERKGEILSFHYSVETIENNRKQVSNKFEHTPLFRLWHIIYSLPQKHAQAKILKDLPVSEHEAEALSKLNLFDMGYGDKSVKAIRKTLPYLMEGNTAAESLKKAGYNTFPEHNYQEVETELLDKLELVPQGALLQPVLEKVMNQLIHQLNSFLGDDRFGRPDEIIFEVGRELKQSLRERQNAYRHAEQVKKEKEHIRDILEQDGIPGTLRNIEKYQLWEEFGGFSPIALNKEIAIDELFREGAYEVLPISLGAKIDQGFNNKMLVPTKERFGENRADHTVYGYMKQKGEKIFLEYIEFIKAYSRKISPTKHKRFLQKYPDEGSYFIEFRLKEHKYFVQKTKEVLGKVCHQVHSTDAAITTFLKKEWGLDNLIKGLNISRFQQADLTKTVKKQHNEYEDIISWKKREDRRYFALNAMTVAGTSHQHLLLIGANTGSGKSSYFFKLPFASKASMEDRLKEVIVSKKVGKRVTVNGLRKVNGRTVQSDIVVPRGILSEESIYGKNKSRSSRLVSLNAKMTLEVAETIIDREVRTVVLEHLANFNNDPKTAFKGYRKNPIKHPRYEQFIDKVEIEIWEEEYVIKRPLQFLTKAQLPKIIDHRLRELITQKHKEEGNRFFSNANGQKPLYQNEEQKIPIKTVKCFTGISDAEPINVYDHPNDIHYQKYVVPGNNHHIALYQDKKGKLHEHVVSFWQAVSRKRFGLPVVIKDPQQLWEAVENRTDIDPAVLEKLPPDPEWEYVTDLQQGDAFVFDMTLQDLKEAIDKDKKQLIAPNLFFVRKLARSNYWFNHQYEVQARESVSDKLVGRARFGSKGTIKDAIKVKISRLGDIRIIK
ncbi:type II CRISPR RNA-guided endonuclease Cas9 [Persicobacter psychrovividus]|uniref:CRISPR-associated endonuclease Cas9 n=1 Tax=Persicobacter psychrovividus TaxID=387638 RepID=A0ABM7VN90_9BACT|nr:CRISPR-associated endonuclease Cas9 [Persicobacter psychrovividus]